MFSHQKPWRNASSIIRFDLYLATHEKTNPFPRPSRRFAYSNVNKTIAIVCLFKNCAHTKCLLRVLTWHQFLFKFFLPSVICCCENFDFEIQIGNNTQIYNEKCFIKKFAIKIKFRAEWYEFLSLNFKAKTEIPEKLNERTANFTPEWQRHPTMSSNLSVEYVYMLTLPICFFLLY